MKTHPRIRCHAFAVSELLIVVAIVAVIVGIAFVAFRMTEQMKRRTVCVFRLRNIGLATRLYAGEHRGRLPLPYSGHTPYVGNLKGLGGDLSLQGFAGLAPYLTEGGNPNDKMALFESFLCPGNPTPVSELRKSWEEKSNLHGSYNQYCGFGPRGLNSAFYPNSRDLIDDETRSPLLFIDVSTAGDATRLSNHRTAEGHATGANAVYVTGEVRWIPIGELSHSVTRSGGTFLFPNPNQL